MLQCCCSKGRLSRWPADQTTAAAPRLALLALRGWRAQPGLKLTESCAACLQTQRQSSLLQAPKFRTDAQNSMPSQQWWDASYELSHCCEL